MYDKKFTPNNKKAKLKREYNSLTGFTLIEVLIVVSLTVMIGALTVPLTVSFLQTQTSDEVVGDMVSTLRRAQTSSLFQRNDSSFGVKVLSSSYVLFEGNSYALRMQGEDETFLIPTSISVTGLDEIVFGQLTGLPSSTGTISVSINNTQRNIVIYEKGNIEK